MTEAPERIWAEPDGDTIIVHNGAENLDDLIATGYLYEYVRKDVAALARPGPDWEGFGRSIMKEWAEHWDIEASDKFELAVKHGLLRKIEGGYNPEVHEGDNWYEPVFDT